MILIKTDAGIVNWEHVSLITPPEEEFKSERSEELGKHVPPKRTGAWVIKFRMPDGAVITAFKGTQGEVTAQWVILQEMAGSVTPADVEQARAEHKAAEENEATKLSRALSQFGRSGKEAVQ